MAHCTLLMLLMKKNQKKQQSFMYVLLDVWTYCNWGQWSYHWPWVCHQFFVFYHHCQEVYDNLLCVCAYLEDLEPSCVWHLCMWSSALARYLSATITDKLLDVFLLVPSGLLYVNVFPGLLAVTVDVSGFILPLWSSYSLLALHSVLVTVLRFDSASLSFSWFSSHVKITTISLLEISV